ncbi:MAG: DNA polymerase III subunit beta [Bacteroidetes bacterium]|nr:DNA polymerase III subunit beta [Bacteroidota bacterium]
MKFIVSSSLLLKNLQQINGVISANTVLPVLEDFLFEIQDKKMSVLATDLETVMRVQMDVESKSNGKVCIPAKILMESLKNIPEQPLTFNIDKNFGIEITSDNGKYKVMGENPDNFPKEPAAESTKDFEVSSSAFLSGISKALISVSADDLRPAMTGVLVELDDNEIRFVSTDAHRLMMYKRKDVVCSLQQNFIVPKKPLSILKNVLPENDDPLKISYNENHLFIQHNTTKLICRLIDARFPDYRVVIPKENPYKMIVNTNDFQSALRRVSIFSNKSTSQVILTISGSELQLAGQDVDFSFEGNERMTCQYDGEDLQIAFNAKFMIEMLAAVDAAEVAIELSTPNKAGIIRPLEQLEGEDIMMLVMPLMINS